MSNAAKKREFGVDSSGELDSHVLLDVEVIFAPDHLDLPPRPEEAAYPAAMEKQSTATAANMSRNDGFGMSLVLPV